MSLESTRISLCLIVKDEAKQLPGCLESAKGAWDELVVVDTGSTDATVAIAEKYGAKVVKWAWQDDFAAARNVSLEHASCEWVLVLDADERLSPELAIALRRVALDSKVGAATVELLNRGPHGHLRTGRLLRFFRREGVKYQHRIHEDCSASVRAQLEKHGRTVVALAGHIDHLGYAREVMAQKQKQARDGGLLDRVLAENPDDLYAWFKRLEQARYWKDSAGARRAAAGALDALVRAEPRAVAALHFGGELVSMIAQVRAEESSEEALRLIERWRPKVQPSAALWLEQGRLREVERDLGGAEAAYRACLEVKDPLGDRQLWTVRPRLGLARLAMVKNLLAEAATLVQQALDIEPNDLEALTLGCVLSRARGGPGGVEKFVLDQVKRHGERAEIYAALGEDALFARDPERAADELCRAVSLGTTPQVALRCAQALFAAGQPTLARVLATELHSTLPEAGLGVLACDLVQGTDSELDLALSAAAADRAMRGWVEMARLERSGVLKRRLQEVAPAVSAWFPWLERELGPSTSTREAA